MASLSALIALSGCQSISTRERSAGVPALRIDGLVLAAERSATTRETIAMLDIESACSRASTNCAQAIFTAKGTAREGTRLVASADILYQSARTHGDSIDALVQCIRHTNSYLFAPVVEGRRGPLDARTQLALRLYNACTAGLLDASDGLPGALDWQVDPGIFPVDAVQRVVRSDRLATAGLRTRQVEDGIGVAAVAFGRTKSGSGSFPAQDFALAINVRAVPNLGLDAIRLVAIDSSQPFHLPSAFGPLVAARDLSAAYAAAAIAFEDEWSWWQALRPPPPGGDVPKIRLLAPIDPAKTPVLLIHGLASSPMTWANLVNDLQGDPDIALHYQFWMVRYPTGLPLLRSRQLLAGAITDFAQTALPDRHPSDRRIIAIGHSMGGVLARLLVTDSGPALWDAAFDAQPSTLKGAPDDLSAASDLFVFSPLQGLDEVVFIAAPHRGSPLANGVLSRIVRHLIRQPAQTVNFLTRLASENPNHVRPAVRTSYLIGGPGSLDTLTPTQPISAAGSRLPVAAGVRVHSIIGIRAPERPDAGDGVVPLDSASWPQGVTHLVPGDHAVHATPAATLIIKRILLDRIDRELD